MNLRKIFSFLRTTSTLLAIASLLSFTVEFSDLSSHEISHAIQQTQVESTHAQLTTDGCDVCRSHSLLVGHETFLPLLEAFTLSTLTEVTASSREFTPPLCILPPSRAPPIG